MTQTAARLTDPLMSTSEPGRWWTSANTAEAMQGVLTPLAFTFQSRGIELGGRRSWHDFGVLPARSVYLPTDPNDSFMGAFYGRIGINVNFAAALMDQMPGATGADIEMALLGFAREGVTYPGTDPRRARYIEAGSRRVRETQGPLLARAAAQLRPWWRATVEADGSRGGDARGTLVRASDRFDRAMYLHLRTRFLLIMAQSGLGQALAGLGMIDALQPLSAAVGTAETEVAEDLWEVSRHRLEMRTFIERHGYHGPNEGVLSSSSWREDERPLQLAVDALRRQAEHDSPAHRRAEAVEARRVLEDRFASAFGDDTVARDMVAFTRQVTAWTEQGKLLTLLALDAGRAAARRLGAALVDDGTLVDPDDVYYLTIGEIRDGLPPNSRQLVAFRRARREEYLGYDVPLTWQNDPVAIAIDESQGSDATTVRGVGVNPGVYQGRVRIVDDPAVDGIDPGDVLVCSATDPSWLALFMLAGAVVVDIGGPTSHGAIVAREFGLPCVMGTSVGSRTFRNGDVVTVDGTAGTVDLVARPN